MKPGLEPGWTGARPDSRQTHAGSQTYRLIELGPSGAVTAENFEAPSDQVAVMRVLQISRNFELWRAGVLVAHCDRWPVYV